MKRLIRFLPRPSLYKFYAMWFVIHTIGALPLKYRYAVSRFMSDCIYGLRPTIRRNIRSNVRHVLGPNATDKEVERIAKQCAHNTGRYYADIVGLGGMDTKVFYEKDLDLRGLEYIREAQARGQGVVMCSAHYGNPEFATQGLAGIGMHVYALVEPLNPPELDRLMRGLRLKHGHRYEPVSFRSVRDALTWLRGGGIVCILIDRDIQKRGAELTLCGAKSRFPTGAADLALRTNSLLMPGWVIRTEGFKIRADIGPPLELIRTGNHDADVLANSQQLLDSFEVALRRDPGQWSVLEKIWPD
jgi:KDO2-lipid IV(A) lauroyltransferase